ncbi:MAG TPA: nucleotidyl transferase AbiEii/AbiGii toxin family protein [Bacillota bacterium]|nr:nucleotidyl transferase AbiEii/AbiGii toxin family protein [Bacillota bacterium]
MDARVLDRQGWEVLARLGAGPLAKSFYLAGGTGLALQLSHHRSLDLDFFTHNPSSTLAWSEMEGALREEFGLVQSNLVQHTVDQATWSIRGTKVSFIAYPFPLTEACVEGRTISAELRGIRLASPREIALMKAYTLGRRALFRDYVDMYFVLRAGMVSLEYILRVAPRKFTLAGECLFSGRLFLEQLVYTKDTPDREESLQMLIDPKLSAEEVETYLLAAVDRVVQAQRHDKGSSR